MFPVIFKHQKSSTDALKSNTLELKFLNDGMFSAVKEIHFTPLIGRWLGNADPATTEK